MKIRDLSEYGIDIKSVHAARDPLGLRDHLVRADLLDELHGIVLPYRRYAHSHVRRNQS